MTSDDSTVQVLACAKRVRVVFENVVVADSRATLLLRSDRFLPTYYFPRHHVRAEHLTLAPAATNHPLGGRTEHFTLAVGERRAEAAAWTFPDPIVPALAALQDHIAFVWPAMDTWFEEDEEVFKHARDPKVRVDALQSSAHIQVGLAGLTIADSHRPVVVFERDLPVRYYLPMDDVRLDVLRFSTTTSRCPYKGLASYWSAAIAGQEYPDIAWTYRDPVPEMPKLTGLVAFYPERVEALLVDGERIG